MSEIWENIQRVQEQLRELPADVPARIDVGSLHRFRDAFPPPGAAEARYDALKLANPANDLAGIPVFVDSDMPPSMFVVRNRSGHITAVGRLP